MSLAKRFALIALVLFCCVGCDQTTKSAAVKLLPPGETLSYLGDSFRFQLVHNEGAMLNLGAALPGYLRYGLFSLGVGAMLLGLAAVGLFNKRLAPPVILAIFLFFAGGLSNLIDRLTLGGYVVDFMNIGIGPVRTGIFNVADMFVMAGGGLFIIQGLMQRRHSLSQPQSS